MHPYAFSKYIRAAKSDYDPEEGDDDDDDDNNGNDEDDDDGDDDGGDAMVVTRMKMTMRPTAGHSYLREREKERLEMDGRLDRL